MFVTAASHNSVQVKKINLNNIVSKGSHKKSSFLIFLSFTKKIFFHDGPAFIPPPLSGPNPIFFGFPKYVHPIVNLFRYHIQEKSVNVRMLGPMDVTGDFKV